MLVEICQAYINTINKGALPNVETAWKYVCSNESQKALKESILELEKRLEMKSKTPLTDEDLEDLKIKV
jgi:hypothetical protein